MRNCAHEGLIHRHSSSAPIPPYKFGYPQWIAAKVSGEGELRAQRRNEYPCWGCDGKPALLGKKATLPVRGANSLAPARSHEAVLGPRPI